MKYETSSLIPLCVMLIMFLSVCLSMVAITIIGAIIEWLK